MLPETSFTILLLGAGRSATALIEYLHQLHKTLGWKIIVADVSATLARQKTASYPGLWPIALDLNSETETLEVMEQSKLVISLLPPQLHVKVARYCITTGCHFISASYLSDGMRALDAEAKAKGLVFLNECGLDPGIDHLSAMFTIDRLRAEGNTITSFKSYCGGLVAPESDNNPWGYKFTWNPINVVLAGQGGVSRYLSNGYLKYINYPKLFSTSNLVNFKNQGDFDAYVNRDALPYKLIYGLENAQTFIRGTLRRKGFCTAWQALIDLGYTEDTYQVPINSTTTWAELTSSFIPDALPNPELRAVVGKYLNVSESILDKIEWLGLFSTEPVGLTPDTPARLLLSLLEKRWALEPHDHDMVLMQHQFGYTTAEGSAKTLISEMAVIGKDPLMTAMALGVGYPLGIAAKLIGQGKIAQLGVQIPVHSEYYLPILAELEQLGIVFIDYEV